MAPEDDQLPLVIKTEEIEIFSELPADDGSFPLGISQPLAGPFLTKSHQLTCYICRPTVLLGSEDRLQEHIESFHSHQDIYRCSECNWLVKTAVLLNKHLVKHDKTTRPFKCSVCPLRYCALNTVMLHETKMHNVDHEVTRKNCCTFCGEKFLTQGHLVKHKRTKHNQMVTSESEPSTNESRRPVSLEVPTSKRCYMCSRPISFDGTEALLKHFDVAHTTQSRYTCKECDFVSLRMIDYNHHLVRHDIISRPYKCDLCTNRYMTLAGKLNHLAVVHEVFNNIPHSCPLCGKKFAYKNQLLRHQRSMRHYDSAIAPYIKGTPSRIKRTTGMMEAEEVHGENLDFDQLIAGNVINKFKCYLCDTTDPLENKDALNHHLMSAHKQLDRYRCGKCPFLVNQVIVYNQHLSRHDGEE